MTGLYGVEPTIEFLEIAGLVENSGTSIKTAGKEPVDSGV